MYGLPKRKHAASGGLIEGPGTGTSDSIDKQAPVGSYIMPADSTAAVGHDGLAKLGLSKKSVPVKVSNGEYEMPPEQVHAVGVQALNQIKDATHQPVAQPAQGPQQFFANGGAISNPLEGVGEYWSKDNAEFESGNPGLMARTGRALNPLTGFGSAVGAMHDAAGQGSIRDMGIAAVQSIPVFGAVRAVAPTLKTAAGLAPSLGKTAIAGSGSVAAGVGADEMQAQSFYQGGPVLDPEELKKKQTSFDITNTPSARPGYDMSPTIRGAQAADDSKMQAKAVAPVVRPGYDAMPVVRSAQAAADRNMQAGAMPAATAPGASSANGAVDSAMQSGSVRNAETAQRGLLGEAVTTAAGQQAIQTALTPTMPTPGNSARAAQMQAQFDQPVTAGAGGQASYGSGGIGESPLSLGNVVRDAYSAVSRPLKAGVGTAGNLVTALTAVPIDAGRNAIIRRAGGDPSTAEGGDTKYQDMAFGTLKPRLDAVSGAYDSAANSLSSSVLSATGAAPLTQPSAPTPARSAVNTASPAGSETPSDAGAAPESPQSIASQYYATNIGTDSQGGQIVMSRGKNGVPEFSNDSVAQDGAQAMPVGGIGGQPLRTPGVSNMADDVALEKRGSINNIGNGIGGGLSVGAPGDAALALGRFERANQEREKMVQISRRGGIGEGGGRVTIVRDSSRAPSNREILALRAANQQESIGLARDQARQQAQQSIMAGMDERLTNQLNRQKTGIDMQVAQLGLNSGLRTEAIRQQLADPSLLDDQRARLERSYASLTTSAKDRYVLQDAVIGVDAAGDPKYGKIALDVVTGQPVGQNQGGQPATRTTATSAEVDAAAKQAGKSRAEILQAMKVKGITING